MFSHSAHKIHPALNTVSVTLLVNNEMSRLSSSKPDFQLTQSNSFLWHHLRKKGKWLKQNLIRQKIRSYSLQATESVVLEPVKRKEKRGNKSKIGLTQ